MADKVGRHAKSEDAIKLGEVFWQRVSDLAEERQINLRQLAERLGLSRTYFYVSRGRNIIPSWYVVAKVAEYLGCSIDYLVNPEIESSTEGASARAKHISFIASRMSDPKYDAVITRLATCPQSTIEAVYNLLGLDK